MGPDFGGPMKMDPASLKSAANASKKASILRKPKPGATKKPQKPSPAAKRY